MPENPDIVLEQVWAFIEQQGFTLESVNPQERLLVARYSGDPRPYVDCGLVTALDDGQPADPPRQYSANKPEVRTAKAPKGRRIGLLRRMQLDARLVVRVEPRGTGARVFSVSTYVAAKSINRLRKGAPAGRAGRPGGDQLPVGRGRPLRQGDRLRRHRQAREPAA